MENTNQIQALDQTVWFHINYRTWQGKKTLTRAELDQYADPEKTPPENLITPGQKAIADPEKLKKINSLGKKIHRECEKVCLKAFGAYGTSESASETLLKRLEGLKAEHTALITTYLDEYEQSQIDWMAENPIWADWLKRSELSRKEIETRFKFEFQAYKITGGAMGAFVNDGVEQELSGLFGTLLHEIEKMAEAAWIASFENKDKVSQKAIRPIRTILNKLETLSYIDGKVSVLIKRVRSVLDALPKTGFIEGADLSSACGLLNLLCSTRRMTSFVQQVSSAQAVKINEDEDDTVADVADMPVLDADAEVEDTEIVSVDMDEAIVSDLNKEAVLPSLPVAPKSNQSVVPLAFNF